MKLYTIDTCALSDLARPPLARLRHYLLDHVRGGYIVVLATYPLLWELAGARAGDAAHFDAMVDLLLRVTRECVLLPAPDRLEQELRGGGALSYPGFVHNTMKLTPDPSTESAALHAAEHEGYVAGLAFHEAERADDAVDALAAEARRQGRQKGMSYDGAAWRRGLGEEFKREAFVLDLIDHYAQTDIADVCARTGLAAPTAHPSSIPTAWARAMVHVARMRAVVVGGTSPTGKKSPNQTDLTHLKEAAAYSDGFVTSDHRLRMFAKTIGGLRCEALSLDEWGQALDLQRSVP